MHSNSFSFWIKFSYYLSKNHVPELFKRFAIWPKMTEIADVFSFYWYGMIWVSVSENLGGWESQSKGRLPPGAKARFCLGLQSWGEEAHINPCHWFRTRSIHKICLCLLKTHLYGCTKDNPQGFFFFFLEGEGGGVDDCRAVQKIRRTEPKR